MREERINNNKVVEGNPEVKVEKVVEKTYVVEENQEENLEGKIEKAYLQEDGTIERELYTAEGTDGGPRSESGPTGTYGEGDRTDRDGWLSAGMADDEYSRNPEGFFKDKDRSNVKPEDQPRKKHR